MGLGPPIIALYQQLRTLGLFDEVMEVMELGSQNVWCPQTKMMKNLFAAFGRSAPPEPILESFVNWTGSARDFYEGLGFKYHCVDTDGKFGALVLDINFDPVPLAHKNKYDFVTNHGTTEHLLNQLNAFKMMHDFTKPGGLMLHALPFLGQVDHGFFNYQPNLFEALGRYNSYQTLGMWVGIDWQLSSLIPWEPKLLDFLVLSPKSTGLLIVLQRRMYATEFQVPFQGMFEQTKTSEVNTRYKFVVDGEVYDGRRDKFLTKDSLTAEEVTKRVTDQVTVLKSRMAEEVTKRVAEETKHLAEEVAALKSSMAKEGIKRLADKVAALERLPVITHSRLIRQLLNLGRTSFAVHANEFEGIRICPSYNTLPLAMRWRSRLFKWVFGSYPRLNRNHAYWTDLRYVVDASERVLNCENARRLIVTNDDTVASKLFQEIPGFVITVPTQIAQKWSLHGVSDIMLPTDLRGEALDVEAKLFDFCFCEVDFNTLIRLRDIVGNIRTAIKPGGKIIVFHLNSTYRPLLQREISLLFGSLLATGSSAVFFAGFPPSFISRIARKMVRIAVSSRKKAGVLRILIHAAVMLLSIPFARSANRLAERQQPSRPPQHWTSVTVEIDVQ